MRAPALTLDAMRSSVMFSSSPNGLHYDGLKGCATGVDQTVVFGEVVETAQAGFLSSAEHVLNILPQVRPPLRRPRRTAIDVGDLVRRRHAFVARTRQCFHYVRGHEWR